MSIVIVSIASALAILFAIGAWFDRPKAGDCKQCGTPQKACTNENPCCPRCVTNKTLHHEWGLK